MAIFCAALIASSMGFLWYNAYPASMMMGDVGALSLGGALGTVALLAKQEMVLPIAAGVSCSKQRPLSPSDYYKMTHKRISGWPQSITLSSLVDRRRRWW